MIKRFLPQQVLGYNAGLTTTYVKSVVKMTDGTTEVFYQSFITGESGKITRSVFFKTRPFVAHSIDAPVVDIKAVAGE